MRDASKPNSPELLENLKKGDSKTIEYLYRYAFHTCATFVKKNSGTMDDAKDIFQESLMVLFRNIQKPAFSLTSDIRTYMYSIVRNLWLKQLHKRSKSGLALVFDDNPDKPFIIVEENEIEYKKKKEVKHLKIAAAMQEIKEDCQELLLNYYFRKIQLKEIASIMGYTQSFVKVKKNRCMESLKKKVKINLIDDNTLV